VARWYREESSQTNFPRAGLEPADLQVRSAQRRPREELRQVTGTLRLALPFFGSHHHGGGAAVSRDCLRPFGHCALNDFAELCLGFGRSPILRTHRGLLIF